MFAEAMDNAVYSVSHLLDEAPKQKEYMVHSHNYCEILLFLRGDADYFVDGKQYRLKPYDLILIPKRTTHCLILNSAAPYENYVIHFYDSLLYLKHREKLFLPPTIFNIKADRELLDLFSSFDRCHERYAKEDFQHTAQCLCQNIVTYFCYMERVPAVSMGTSGRLIPNIVQYIDSHLTEELTADVLAKEFSISRSYLQNMFSSEMKQGLKQYVMVRKVKAAQNEILNGTAVGDVALRYGFRDYSTFFRLYKKVFGISPSGVKQQRTLEGRKTVSNEGKE